MILNQEEKYSTHLSNCASCGIPFACHVDDISQCECTKISLSAEQRATLKKMYSTCLCNSCLLKFKTDLLPQPVLPSSEKVSENKGSLLACLFILFTFALHAQTYAPAADLPGTSAMYKDSSAFVDWVKSCIVTRGYQDISNKSLGFASVGDESMVIDKAQANGVLSLGDGGSVICEFNYPITNGDGFDFAVFENSIDNTFLELAFVEVSSDGINFYRFKSHSLTDTLFQTSSFGSTSAIKINNLAGKYRAGYGTPFDLMELEGINGLNINAITHIKIIDVVGSLNNAYATTDGFGNKVNDPWPTPFPSGGFDLDAIGVIHQQKVVSLTEEKLNQSIQVFPNPVQSGESIFIKNLKDFNTWKILSMEGVTLIQSNSNQINTGDLTKGVYLLKIVTTSHTYFLKLIIN